MSKNPVAFMSYVRSDDQHENGRLTQFRERLSGEVRMQSGERFDIFQDRNDIAWGQQWKQRIENALDTVTFLIPVITPAFFRSPACRGELERFLRREGRLERNDLVLPLYYVECAALGNDANHGQDPLVTAIAARQLADWRELRFEPFTSPEVGKRLALMARQIVKALRGVQTAPAKPEPVIVAPATDINDDTDGGATQTASYAALGDSTRRPEPKTEIPTIVVDALHRGDYSTLTQALEAAKPGTRILIRPGLYKEGVVIDKPVEVVGDGDKADIVFEAFGKNVILFRSSMGRVANLTLRQTGGGNRFGVDVSQGRLDLEGCDISSQSLACIAIHDGADPRLRRNRIHDGKQAGIYFHANGQGTLEDNDIFGNAFAGVEIKEGGNPTLRRNRIHDGKQAGVYVHTSGQGTLEDNDIFGNAGSGVVIERGNPTLRRNRIHDGKQLGVYVYMNGQGTLEENDIFGNAFAGVAIKGGGNPTLRRNRIHHGKQGGVIVYMNGEGMLEDNDIFGNAFAGVEIRESGNPTLRRRNRVHDGKQDGVLVHANGQGMLEDNDIFGNQGAGVLIREGGSPTLRRNRVSKNATTGISVAGGGGGVFEANDLRGNTRGAWEVAASSESKIRREGNIVE